MSYLAYKTKLKLNNQQKTKMRQCAGYSRWVWNWGLDFKQKAYDEGIKLSKSSLRKYYTNYVKPLYPWQFALSSKIYQYVFIDLDEAYKRFFQGVAKYPNFKKKGKSQNSFTIDASGKSINLGGKLHKLPFFGWLKTYEKLPICSTKKITFSERGGNGADITITTPSLSLSNQVAIIASTIGQGNAGNIFINATDSVSLDNSSQLQAITFSTGDAGNIVIDAENADISFDNQSLVGTVVSPGGIEQSGLVSPGGIGQGGDVTITASSLSLTNGAQIITSTFGKGDAGNISIEVRDFINLSNSSNIRSIVELEGIGNGGDIAIKARSLTLQESSQIATSVFREEFEFSGGQGIGGDITIEATDFVDISGVSNEQFLFVNPADPSTNFLTDITSSGIFTGVERGGAGLPGNITIFTKDFRIADGAIVNAFTNNIDDNFIPSTNSDIGNITIDADTFEATGGGQVIATT